MAATPPPPASAPPPAPQQAPIQRSAVLAPTSNKPSANPQQPNQTQQAAPRAQTPPIAQRKIVKPGAVPFWIGLLASIGWIVAVLTIVARSGPTHSFGGLPLADWAIGISAIASPVALIWMVTAYLQRATDIQFIAEPLRRQLAMITGESGAAETRIRRFNHSIREQIDLLKSAQSTRMGDLTGLLERLRQNRDEIAHFEQSCAKQVGEIQDVIRQSMQQIETMMDDKFTMLRVLDDRIAQSGSSLSRQTDHVHEKLADLLDEVNQNGSRVEESLDRAMRDSKKLSDTAHAQESTLLAAAENAAETLGVASSKIDLSVARFLERAGGARSEAERLAGALDTQTRALDEFSNTLPSRVSEAESVIRGVADRLYASEQLAREQANNLSEKLSQQVNNLQGFLDNFASRVANIDGGLKQRRMDLEAMAQRIGETTEVFADAWEESISSLGMRTRESLTRFSSFNDETRRDADKVVSQLNDTVNRYAECSLRMHGMSEESSAKIRSMSSEIVAQISQFETLHDVARKTGVEVQDRASAAMQNLQLVLERLLSAREATQAVGNTLVKDLHAAVDNNELLIGRLNEAAQISVRALGIATESMGKQEADMADRARASETTIQQAALQLQEQARATENNLREQTGKMMELLGEVTARIEDSEQRIKNFAAEAVPPINEAMRQVDASVDKGSSSFTRYGDGIQEQLSRLQSFHGQVGGMGDGLTRITTETLASIEQLAARFVAVRAEQEASAHKTLDQFASISSRLHSEVSGLDGQAGKAVEVLEQAAARVGEQSQRLLQDAEASGSKMQLITTALQNEASQIRAVLQKQADDLGADLNRAEKQFATLGDALRQRTDSAYTLLDRVAAHYNETTRAAAQELDARTMRLEQVAGQTQSKVESLTGSIAQQLGMIGSGTTQLESQASQIGLVTNKALQNLTSLNEKFVLTHETANTNVQQTIARIEECNTAFMRQSNGLTDAAQNSVAMIQKAGTAFGEQAGKLTDTSRQTEQNIRQLTATASALSEQATQLRASMEQQNQRLVSQLTETVAQVEAVSHTLAQTTTAATQSADQATTRFNDMTQNATMRLGSAQQEILSLANKTETSLTSLGANVTQQTASLSVLSEQLAEQYKMLETVNASQRTQLVDLFDRLGAAHSQASEVAERTILRLGESISQIERNLGALSDQSQTALGNVRAATTGFADQSGLLLQHAQQAEQQARSAMSVTSALQDQAKQLRESMQSEGDRTGELLSGLIGKLTSGSAAMRDLGATTETSLNGMHEHIMQETQGLSAVMQQINDRQRTLTATLESQREVLSGLVNRLCLAQDETGAGAERAAAKLTESADAIGKQAETMSKQTQEALIGVQNVSANFVNETSTLSQSAQQAEQQARAVLSVTTALQEQARQLRETMNGESDRARVELGSLLSRISTGSAELRDIAATTEMSLGSLGNGVTQQTQDLSTTVQQITDRQRSLTIALDAQRDVLNGLLSRLTLAQDETASVTERTVSRLNDGAQQVTRQIETISQQAQTTLASVQTAAAGFASESGSLTSHAQQAEQSMRNVLSSTASLQEQSRHLRETLQGESSQVIEQISGILRHLDTANTQLKTQSGDALQSLDDTATRFTSIAAKGVEAMQMQSQIMDDVADRSEARMSAVDNLVRHQIQTIKEACEETEQQSRRLSDSTEFATGRLTTLRGTMADSDKEGQIVIESAAQRIAQIKTALQDELKRLSEVSFESVQQVASAAQSVATQNEALRANMSMSESALNHAAMLVREEADQLPTTLDRGATKIEEAARALKAHAAEIEGTLVGTADRFISVTTTAREGMVDEMRHISAVAGEADQVVRQFNKSLAEQTATMQQGAELLTTSQHGIIEKAKESVTQLSAAGEQISRLRADAAQSAERLSHDFEMMDQRANASSQRLAQAGDVVVKHIDALSQASQRAEAQMLGSSGQFREQFERIRTGLQGQIDDINRGLMQITAQLERTSNSLRSTTSGTLSDIEHISQRFDQTNKDASTQLTDKTVRMRSSTEEVAKLLSGFGDQLDVLLDRLALAGDGIRRNEGDLVGQLQTALTHLDGVASKLEESRNLTTNVSAHAVSRLSEVMTEIHRDLQSLTTSSQTAAGVMRGLGQIYTDQTQTLDTNVTGAHTQVEAMNKSIDEMQQRTDRMRVSLKMQSEELMGSLQLILQQLAETGDMMGSTVDNVLQERAAAELHKIN
ncbi:MAG: hypothetical protein ABTQ34_09955 [Bdellovibrionales bacterium]